VLTGQILHQSARRHPTKTALISGDRQVSYGDLASAANRVAHAMLGLGISKSDTIAIMSSNIPEYVMAHFGSAQTGAILCNLMPAYAPDELVAILEQTGAKLVIVEAAFQTKIADVFDRLPALEHVVVIGKPALDGWHGFYDFIAGQPETTPKIDLDESDPFAMTFTGGTTGRPKGAMVSHHSRYVSVYTIAIEQEVTEDDVVGLLTPLYHAMGSLVWMPTALFVGATCVMLQGWDADRFVEETDRHSISNVMMVPLQLGQLLDEKHFDKDKLASLRMITCAGAITPSDLVLAVNAKLPDTKFTDHYGQSETGPICIYKHNHPREKAATVGRPALGVDFKLLDQAGQEVPVGETGEIVVRGPFLMDGYYNNPEETAAYFKNRDGWAWTGDLATMDEDGFVTLAGRSKDMIVSGGVNIYPREVEITLEQHPDIRDCTVFGIPDNKWGEALCALVVVGDGAAVGEADILTHCSNHLARFKRPKVVRLVDNIPKTPAGKVQKPLLRAAFLKENPTS
jgi:acyl-CoA synthetase (AMP-forming)/AMP-acid ligase II